MENKISLLEWIGAFTLDEFLSEDVKTQIKAGWYDWFCKDSSLRNKTYKMGRIITQFKEGGKIDFKGCYVWFKNNCPLNGPLYDDFRIASLEDGEVQFTVQLDCVWNLRKYTVYGRKGKGEHFDCNKPLFESDSVKELVKWFNTPWETENV